MSGLPGASDVMGRLCSARVLLHGEWPMNEHYHLGRFPPGNVSAEVRSRSQAADQGGNCAAFSAIPSSRWERRSWSKGSMLLFAWLLGRTAHHAPVGDTEESPSSLLTWIIRPRPPKVPNFVLQSLERFAKPHVARELTSFFLRRKASATRGRWDTRYLSDPLAIGYQVLRGIAGPRLGVEVPQRGVEAAMTSQGLHL